MSFIRKVFDKEGVVKSNLISRLADCIKELQFKNASEETNYPTLTNDEVTNTLCWVLEATFIHGLQSPFLKSMSSALRGAGSTTTRMPEPSFWEFVLVFCHQEVIMQINQLSLITSDVGRCRAWLRLTLNDGLLLSYLQLMSQDKSTLRAYYKPSAFLRDAEKCDMMKSYLFGLESCKFNLAANSSLLNVWNSGPLSLIGMWYCSSDSVSEGFDVASNMNADEMQTLSKLHQGRTPPSVPHDLVDQLYKAPLLDEDEALKVILSSGKSSQKTQPGPSHREIVPIIATPVKMRRTHGDKTVKKMGNVKTTVVKKKEEEIIVKSSSVSNMSVDANLHTNSVSKAKKEQPSEELDVSCGSSSGIFDTLELSNNLPEEENTNEDVVSVSNDVEKSISSDNIPFASLFKHLDSGGRTVVEKSEGVIVETNEKSDNFDNTETTISCQVEKPKLAVKKDKDTEGSKLLQRYFYDNSSSVSFMEEDIMRWAQKIPTEVGMDTQNYRCQDCGRMIGMVYGKPRVCYFTGNYYCDDCHKNEESVIPSRILCNWDFNKYTVSVKAKEFLHDQMHLPIFHIQKINHRLYDHLEEFTELFKLRTKLHAMFMYLKTCKEPVMEKLKNDPDFQPHYFEHLHTYSLDDLLNVPNRSLETRLAYFAKIGEKHIKCCLFCGQKGFVCEICRKARVIFPFQLETIFKCSDCGAVYHKECMNASKPCPRCLRWKRVETKDSSDIEDNFET